MYPGRGVLRHRSSPPAVVLRVVLLVGALLLAPLPPGGAGSAAAQSSDELREQEGELREELEDARDAEAGISSELEDAAEVRAEVETALLSATAAVDAVFSEIDAVNDQRAGLQAEVEVLGAEVDERRGALGAQIRTLYITGAAEDFIIAMNADAASEVSTRAHYLEALARNDTAEIEQLSAVTTTLAARQADLDRVEADLDLLRAEAEAAQSELDRQLYLAAGVEAAVADRLAEAEAEARRLAVAADEAAAAAARAEAAERAAAEAAAAEAARQAEAARAAAQAAATAATATPAAAPDDGDGAETADSDPPPPSAAPVSSGMACPQDHPRSFTDTWGAPRSGGRTHKGTDIFGARGGNVFAITDGVISRTSNGSLSGLYLVLTGDDGHQYYYMHLQDFVASSGQRVSAGQLIAHNGDTGNARGTTPHIHFEYHPGGGSAVNPYPLLRQVCG